MTDYANHDSVQCGLWLSKKNPGLLDILYYTLQRNHYLLTAASVFRTGFSPEENLESLSNVSAGESRASRQWQSARDHPFVNVPCLE